MSEEIKHENLVFSRKEPFLYVGVSKGASRPEIVAAVDKALAAREVPFFNQHTAAPPSSPTPTLAVQLEAAKTQPGGKAEDALLILVQQEGW